MTAFFSSNLSQQAFLNQYWQKKPLLIRQALPGFTSPLSAEELAGLACEDEVESRLIEEHGETGPWQCRHGPFTDADFSALPETHWTLLVQDVDKHVPSLSSIMHYFKFIPEWRRDDLMISFAPAGGSVGPHTDGYDVFLLQGMGNRRWQVGREPLLEAKFIDGLDLKILQQFEPEQTWELQPGDMLYLPPHFAHHGVALNDCMTFSIGFRAPTQLELLDAFMQTLTEQTGAEQRYQDAELQVARDDKQIDAAALKRFKQMLLDTVLQSDSWLNDAVGRLLTETKPSLSWFADITRSELVDEETLKAQILAGNRLVRNPYIRLAWLEAETDIRIYAAGESISLDKHDRTALSVLLGEKPIAHSELDALLGQSSALRALVGLLDVGAWHWEDVAA